MTRIPAFTIWRPWARCFTALPTPVAKRVENRRWTTHYRGPMWIHAGQRWAPAALPAIASIAEELKLLGVGRWISEHRDDHPTGFVAVAGLVDICTASADADELRCGCGPWAFPAQNHWRFADDLDVLPDVIPGPGAQGLWWPKTDPRELAVPA